MTKTEIKAAANDALIMVLANGMASYRITKTGERDCTNAIAELERRGVVSGRFRDEYMKLYKA